MADIHQDFLQQAIDLANKNVLQNTGGPFGAIIVRQGQIIASSGNQVTTLLDPSAHAEIMAIRQACQALNHFQLTDSILYTSCEPCPMCLGAIYWARLKAVYFAATHLDAAQAGFDDRLIYEQIDLQPEQRLIPMYHQSVVDFQKPFQTWLQFDQKILY